MASKRKRNVLSMEKKLEAINRLEKGECLKNIARSYGVGTSTVGDWKKNKSQIEDFCSKMVAKDSLGERATIKTAKYQSVDEALFLWFSQERERGVPLSGPIIQEKALSLNKKLNGDPSFSASGGWLGRWKCRHGIRQLTVTGESMSADSPACEAFMKKFMKLVSVENLSPSQIYNADETGLFYKMLPNKTLASKLDDKAKGHKKNKERITILTCSNASGTHKLPLLVVGKSAKPRALKHANFNTLPVKYTSQKSAWMSAQIFKSWFFEQFVPSVKTHLSKEGLPEKAMLLLDNAPTHPSEEELKSGNIFVKFLPPHATALIQPMDQGVIEAFKRKYRKMLLRRIIDDEEEQKDITTILKQINIKDVIYMAATAWEDVSISSLVGAWKKLWPDIPHSVDSSGITEDTHSEVLGLFKQIDGCNEVTEDDVLLWINSDEDPGHQILSEEEIVAACSSNQHDETSESSEDDVEETNKGLNHSEATKMFEDLTVYLERQSDTTAGELLLMKRLRDRSAFKRTSKLKQKQLFDFFRK